MSDFSDIARQRIEDLAAIRKQATAPFEAAEIHRDSSYRNSRLIETPEGSTRWDELTLPVWLAPLVQNVQWARRFASLLNDGHYAQLRKLVEVIETSPINKKTHFLNRSCSHANWATTVRRMNELLATERLATEVEHRLSLDATDSERRAIYAACYRLRGAVVRYAVTVQEMAQLGKVKTTAFKFFNWLVSPGALERQQLAAAAWSPATAV